MCTVAERWKKVIGIPVAKPMPDDATCLDAQCHHKVGVPVELWHANRQ